MKLKAVISHAAPEVFFKAFGGVEFAGSFLEDVVSGVFGVEMPERRPAEYYVQVPDEIISTDPGYLGVEVRLTGVSRGDRPNKMLHHALGALEQLVLKTAVAALNSSPESVKKVQVFIVIMLDAEIEIEPNSGIHSRILETVPVWVDREGIVTKTLI